MRVRGAEGGDGVNPVDGDAEDDDNANADEGEDVEEEVEVEDALCSMPAKARSNSAEPDPPGALPMALAAAVRVSMMAGMPPRTFGTMAKSLPRITGWMPIDCDCEICCCHTTNVYGVDGGVKNELEGEGGLSGRGERGRKKEWGCTSSAFHRHPW